MGDFVDYMRQVLLARDRAEERAKGKAETLIRQLTRRFGTLPDDARARIGSADLKALDRWLDRVIDAPESPIRPRQTSQAAGIATRGMPGPWEKRKGDLCTP